MIAVWNLHVNHLIYIYMYLRAHKCLLWLRMKQSIDTIEAIIQNKQHYSLT